VRDHGLAVLGDLHVELERRDADPQGVGEGLQRALRDEPEPAAVGLEIEAGAGGRPLRRRGGRDGQQDRSAGGDEDGSDVHRDAP
jgi:hypothetical protein